MSVLFAMVAAAIAAGISIPARATTLLNLVDAPVQTTPFALSFIASSSSTTISFGGYQVPASEQALDIGLFLGGVGPNLLGGAWTFTPAPAGSLAFTFNDGTSVPALLFLGTVAGDYDTFSQTIATTPGSSYTLDFLFILIAGPVSSGGAFAPNGLLVEETGATAVTPLPGTLPLFATSLAALGLLGRRRKMKSAALAA